MWCNSKAIGSPNQVSLLQHSHLCSFTFSFNNLFLRLFVFVNVEFSIKISDKG